MAEIQQQPKTGSSKPRWKDVTHIGRILDPRYPTNLVMLILAPLGGIAFGIIGLVRGAGLPAAIAAGLYGGAVVFASWALGRELDPDHDYSAFLAVIIALIGVFVAPVGVLDEILGASPGEAFLIALSYTVPAGLLVSLLRIINRTVGLPPTGFDYFYVTVGGIISMVLTGEWLIGAAFAIGMLIDAGITRERKPWIAFIAAFVSTIGVVIWKGYHNPEFSLTLPYIIGMIAITLWYLLAVIRSSTLKATCDAKRNPLNPLRVQNGMLLVLALVLAFALWDGDAGVRLMGLFWAAMAGVGLYVPVAIVDDLRKQK